MASKTAKRIGIVIGILVLIIIALGAYFFSQLPKPQGKPIVLQQELFKKPEKDFPFTGKFIYKSAAELHQMLVSHEATSVQIVTDFINNIKNNNYKYCALIYLREAEALDEAKKADEAIAAGDTSRVLLGVPVTIKEHYWVKGSPCTMNAKMFGFTAYENAPIVEEIKKSGAIILGTTNVPFMLGDWQTQGEVYPTASNPYDTTRSPGGSTGGGGAALAAGFTTLELGSDLGGSVRVPSAFCGLWGLKTTFGSLNVTEETSPDTVNSNKRFALNTAGPLARNPEDLETLWNIMRTCKIDERFQTKTEWQAASNKNLNDYKFAWIDDWKRGTGSLKVSDDVKEKLAVLLDSLKTKGAMVEKDAPDMYDEMLKSFLQSYASIIAEKQNWVMRKLIGMSFKKLDDGTPVFQSFFEAMNDGSDEQWQKISAERKSVSDKFQQLFTKHDFLICAVTYGEAIKKCPQGSAINAYGATIPYAQYFPYTYIFNPTGNPSLVVPLGLNKNGMPIVVQIVGPLNSEPELLHLAKLLKPITPGFVKPK